MKFHLFGMMREAGAIGSFSRGFTTVEANTPEEAVLLAMETTDFLMTPRVVPETHLEVVHVGE